MIIWRIWQWRTWKCFLMVLKNLWEGWGLDIGFNALYTDDQTLRSFLDSKQGGEWEATQTVAPTSLVAGDVGSNAAEFFWKPIIYSWDPGEYRVLAATSSGGPYQSDGSFKNFVIASLNRASSSAAGLRC